VLSLLEVIPIALFIVRLILDEALMGRGNTDSSLPLRPLYTSAKPPSANTVSVLISHHAFPLLIKHVAQPISNRLQGVT
jgi:hypothetical protein